MKKAIILLTIAAMTALTPVFSAAQTKGRITLEEEEALLRNWSKTLGSDEFGGRKPMTQFETKTINYLAEEMKKIGLEPAFDGSWFQKVQTISTVSRPEGGKFKVKGKSRTELNYPEDLVVWTARAANTINIPSAEFVFCGFGIDAPEFGWNDFDGIDVKGKIIIAMVNDPGFYDASLFQGKKQ